MAPQEILRHSSETTSFNVQLPLLEFLTEQNSVLQSYEYYYPMHCAQKACTEEDPYVKLEAYMLDSPSVMYVLCTQPHCIPKSQSNHSPDLENAFF